MDQRVDAVVGWEFTAKADITVVSLGMWDSLGDGFSNQSTADVGLWTTQGDLLASATVVGTDVLIDGFRYTDIAAVQLRGGENYVVAGVFSDAGSGPSFNTFAFDVTITDNSPTDVVWVDSRASNALQLTFPTDFQNFNGFFGANFRFVDEPSVFALMLSGVCGLGVFVRRRRLV